MIEKQKLDNKLLGFKKGLKKEVKNMTTVKDIERGISSLPLKELAGFHAWFEEFDAQAWDKQFEEDAKSGRLDKIGKKAIEDFNKGKF